MRDEKAIFHAARVITTPAERHAYLDQACAGDLALRRRVETLLDVIDNDPNFLENPVPQPTFNDSIIGAVIGPYRLCEKLGEGGMGMVYRAEQKEPVQREVALKIILPGMDSRQVIARFDAERQALAMMDHPNIAKVLDAGQIGERESRIGNRADGIKSSPPDPRFPIPDSRPYFVMELVRGVPITAYCDENRLTPRERLELFIPVCRAVQHAHQKGIIHRDLKPSNVLVAIYDGRPVAKIIDFGVAKATSVRLSDRSFATGFGAIIGTLEYMSPEQAEPNEVDIDTRSDIYSLGVLLYELLTGTTPLRRERLKSGALLEMLRMIREEEPPSPSTRLSTVEELPSIAAKRGLEPKKLSGAVRGDLDWIVMKSLEKDRTRRYETASGLARDLERYLCEEPVEARPPSAAYRFRKFAKRNKPALATALAFALLLIAATAFSSWQAHLARQAERVATSNEQKAIAARERADEEAAISKAISDFLQRDLLDQADIANQPRGTPRDKNMTVRALLDRASERIGDRFAGQELTEAAIRLTLGGAYAALGEFPRANEHLQRSVALRTQILGEDHIDTVVAVSELAQLERMRGQFDEAEKKLKRILNYYTTRFGEKHRATLRAVCDLGILYVGSSQRHLAEEYLTQALQGRRAEFGPSDLDTLTSLDYLGLYYQLRNKTQKAAPLLQQVLDGYREQFGPDHPRTLNALANLGTNYYLTGQYGTAEPLLREALEGRRKKVGADHPSTLSDMAMLGQLCEQCQRFDEAVELYVPAVEGQRVKLGASHPSTINTMTWLARCYNTMGRWDDAEKLLKQVLEIHQATPGVAAETLVKAKFNIGFHYWTCRRLNDAEPILRGVAADCEKHLPFPTPLTQSVMLVLSEVDIQRGQPQLAEPPLRKMADYLKAYNEPGDESYTDVLAWLSLCLLDQKHYAEAEATARECLELRTTHQPSAWTVHDAQLLLGRVLAGQKKFTEAEPILLQGVTGLFERSTRLTRLGQERLTAGFACLVQMYDEQGKSSEAQKWRQKMQSSGK